MLKAYFLLVARLPLHATHEALAQFRDEGRL
jgi:hypothetical protein